MKFMIEYSIRNAGLTYEQSLANSATLLTAFSKGKPEDGLKVQAFLAKIGGGGGYAAVETDDPNLVQAFVSKFAFWNDITVAPVAEIGVAQAAIAWASAAAKA